MPEGRGFRGERSMSGSLTLAAVAERAAILGLACSRRG